MIGKLKGTVDDIDGTNLVVDVAGLGYELEVSARVLEFGCTVGDAISLSTHFVVREDAQLLYGFADSDERDLFRIFIRINGVGPRMAMALISSMPPAALAAAVQENDIAQLTHVPGVGKKTAERLMVELRSRTELLLSQASSAVPVPSRGAGQGQEAEDALIALGYKPHQASAAIAEALVSLQETETKDMSTEALVTWVLRRFARGAAS